MFELRDKLAGAVPQRHLPDKKKHPEDRGDKCVTTMKREGITHEIELHKPAPQITMSNRFKKGNSIDHLHIEMV